MQTSAAGYDRRIFARSHTLYTLHTETELRSAVGYGEVASCSNGSLPGVRMAPQLVIGREVESSKVCMTNLLRIALARCMSQIMLDELMEWLIHSD